LENIPEVRNKFKQEIIIRKEKEKNLKEKRR